jgi:predicted ATPase/DNA-binding CsgD family transcriptional regulator
MQDKIIIFPEPPPDDHLQLVMPSLPVSLTQLVGREQEVQALHALLLRPDVRLLTLTGAAGVGKTRLALEVARHLVQDFADGVYLVSLAPLSDPDLVIPTIAQSLGVIESGSQPLLDLLKTSQRNRRRLLVLDNFEQVVTAAQPLTDLLTFCSDLKLLVTSRAPLHVQGEHEFPVSPLAVPNLKHLPESETLSHSAAVVLFLQRAQAIKPSFQITTANARAIAEICIRLDGLPLAIELAAARIKLLSPQALLTRLEHRLHLLTSGAQDAPTRQQTLRNAIGWSYNLLNAQEQNLFRRLSVFIGGCTLETIEAVCVALDKSNGAGRVLDGVASLIDKSLLQQMEQEDGEPRFAMLETNREYGLEALTAAGEAEATHQAHALYYLTLAEQAEPELTGPQQLAWFERLEREHDNLRAALSWLLEPGTEGQRKELALRLSGALSRFWGTRGYVSEGRRWLERVLDQSYGVRSAARAKALIGAGRLATLHDDFGHAEEFCAEGLAIYRELGDRRGSAAALSRWGYAAVARSNYPQARALLEEALALSRELDDAVGSAFVISLLSGVLRFQGEYARAQALLEESLILSETAGDVQSYALSLLILSTVLLFQGDLVQAQARLEESLAVSRKVGYKRNIALSIYILGIVTFEQGDVTRARALYEESLVLLKEVGERGRIASVLANQGRLSLCQGDYAVARALLEESLQLSLELDEKWEIIEGLEGIAAVLAAQGEPGRAAGCLSAAQALREAIGVVIPPVFQPMHEFTMASVRRQLGERTFAAAWAEGRRMTAEQVLVAQEPVPLSTAISAEPYLPSPAKGLSTSPEGLTARELEVLRLLAQGLTSAQIAERLVIGVVTVNFHVRSIYSKLGVSSRSAATRYAIEHHLV